MNKFELKNFEEKAENKTLKEKIEELIKKFIDKSSKKMMIEIPYELWFNNYDYIISKLVFHNFGIQVNGFCGGGYNSETLGKLHAIWIEEYSNENLPRPTAVVDFENIPDSEHKEILRAIEAYKVIAHKGFNFVAGHCVDMS